MLKVIIIDDDELSRLALKKCVERAEFMEVSAEFSSALTALEVIDDLNCDVILLDIEMPEMTGIEFINQAKNIPQVVIVSSKDEYAAEAFNYDVTDYLVKPIEYPRFLKAALKVKSINEEITNNNINQDHLFIKKNNTYVRVEFSEIYYIEAYADYVNIHTIDQKFIVLSTMKAIEMRFPQQDFMRIHRSFIVRLDKISSIEENAINIGGKMIPVSRSYRPEFMKRMNIF